MIKVLYSGANPHELTVQKGNVTQDLNVLTVWSPERKFMNPDNPAEMRMLIEFLVCYSSGYIDNENMTLIQVDQFTIGKFRHYVDISGVVNGVLGEVIEDFVYEFSRNYIATNFGVPIELISKI